MTTASYAEVARAEGAWICPFLLAPTPFDAVRAALTALAADTGWPAAAFVYGGHGDPVTELLLVRDPSRTHGTPGISACAAAASFLAAETGWSPADDRAPRSGVLVGLGLREGYSPYAPRHALAEVEAVLAEHGTGWRTTTARLVSARRLNGEIRWYDEVGVVVQAPAEMTPVIERIAAAFAQHRFVITDLDAGATRALAWPPSPAHAEPATSRLLTD